MENYKVFTFTNTWPRVAGIHLIFDQVVQVVAVDGVSPDQGNYSLSGNNTKTIDIKDIDKQKDATMSIRIKYTGDKEPTIIDDKKVIGHHTVESTLGWNVNR